MRKTAWSDKLMQTNKIKKNPKTEQQRQQQPTAEQKPINESVHSDFSLAAVLADIKEHLGIITVAEAGHGKSFAVASMVQQALKDSNLSVIVLSPSTIWRRKLWSGKYVKVGTADFNPIQEITKTEIESVPFLRNAVHVNLDKKWSYVKNQWLEGLLQSKESLLFEIKYRNGRRIKAFESLIIQRLYEMQERRIEANPNYNHHYLIVLEEIQNSFGTYSMNSDDSLDLMTIFSQSRSDANIHYIGIGQRLNDISTKVIERLRPFIGLTLGENSLRKIKSQLPDELKDRVQQLPKRHWLYLDGKTNPEIEIPEFKRTNPPVQIKPPIKPPVEHLNSNLTPLQRRYRAANPLKKGLMLCGAILGIYGNGGNGKQTEDTERDVSEESENFDQSVYSDNSKDTQENYDMEEDLALLEEKDMGW
jgi:hypothetical protein